MLNHCVLTGNLGADPEIHYSNEGDPISSFDLAFRFGRNNTGWIKVTCFNRVAEAAEKYLHKGASIGVSGTLTQDTWETQSKEKRTCLKLIAQSLEFIKTDGRGFENGEPNSDLPF